MGKNTNKYVKLYDKGVNEFLQLRYLNRGEIRLLRQLDDTK